GGLKGVLRVGMVAEDAAAHPHDHGAVAAHEGLEGSVVPPRDVRCQQFAVRRAGLVSRKGVPTQALDQPVEWLARRHVRRWPLPFLAPYRRLQPYGTSPGRVVLFTIRPPNGGGGNRRNGLTAVVSIHGSRVTKV